jgi:phosphatidylglycerol lysyltransferase
MAEQVVPEKHLLARWWAPVLSVAIFVAVIFVLGRSLSGYHVADVIANMHRLTWGTVGIAFALSLVSYVVLTGYDILALRYVEQPVNTLRAMLTSFIAFAVGHNIGLATLTGAAIRGRMYGTSGVGGIEIALISAFCILTTTLGALVLIAVALITQPGEASLVLRISSSMSYAFGIAIALGLVGYFIFVQRRREPIAIRNWSVRLPSLQLSIGQTLVGAIDLCFAAGAMYVLLPPGVNITYAAFLAVFVLATVATLVSNVPGGLGVLESVVLLAMPGQPADQVLAALLAYRLVYFLVPLALAAIMLAAHEAWLQRHRILAAADVAVDWMSTVAPQTLGTLVFVAGGILLVSGATPSIDQRLEFLDQIVPLPILELSHLLGSIVGLALIILSRALFRRVHLAWQLALALLGVGALFSLLKGFDYEEAMITTVVALLLFISKRAFYRRATLNAFRFTPKWLGGFLVMVGAVLWVAMLAHRHVEYSRDLWWTFAIDADSSRVLRAGVAVALLAAGFVLLTWLSPAKPTIATSPEGDIDRAKNALQTSRSAVANLALLGDKQLLIHPAGDAFLMYQVVRRSWIAMGDPVGNPARAQELAWSFREQSDRHGGWTVFYQATPGSLSLYVDLGLTMLKLGEEARVKLDEFNLEGSKRAELRTARRRAEKEGAQLEVLSAPVSAEVMSELAAISTEWLAEKAAGEKRFSVGYFDPAYLANFPIAVVRREGKIVAFTNLWLSGTHEELSVDLMRHSNAAPKGVMDFLFIELMLWAKTQGFHWFNLGMAPLSGLEQRPLAPAWHRLGNLIFDMGESFYNFEGLRRYKEKFQPTWEPRYLAAPGGLALPRVLLDVTALIAGGFKEIVTK